MLTEMPEPEFPLHVGHCIYCLATDGLTDEHVVPHSLGGTWKLLKASCPRCQKIVSAIERRVSREDLIALRTVARFPTYHPKRRPKALDQGLDIEGERTSVVLPPEAHPAAFIMLTYDPPAFLTGKEHPPVPHVPIARTFARRAKVQALSRSTGATGLTVALPDREVFARLLAKIALGFAAAVPGLANIEKVFLRPAILGESHDLARWVGCVTAESFTGNRGLHEVVSIVRDGRIEVAIRLFSKLPNSPEYRVVVGTTRAAAT